MAKVIRYIYLAIKIVIFLLLLVLVIDNIQPVIFKVFGLYEFKMPLILIILISFTIGVVLGRIFGIFHMFELKSRNNALSKELAQIKLTNKSGELN